MKTYTETIYAAKASLSSGRGGLGGKKGLDHFSHNALNVHDLFTYRDDLRMDVNIL